MSKIVELKAGEIQNVVGGVGTTAMVVAAKPTGSNNLNATSVQLPQPPTKLPMPRLI